MKPKYQKKEKIKSSTFEIVKSTKIFEVLGCYSVEFTTIIISFKKIVFLKLRF